MSKRRLQTLPESETDKTIGQQMEDLGVEVVKTTDRNTVTDVTWARRYLNVVDEPPVITVGKERLYLNGSATHLLYEDEARYDFGVGNYRNKKVLVIRRNDKGGYKITPRRRGGRGSTAGGAGLPGYMEARGLPRGTRYRVVEVNQGWIGLKIE